MGVIPIMCFSIGADATHYYQHCLFNTNWSIPVCFDSHLQLNAAKDQFNSISIYSLLVKVSLL